MGVHVNQEFTSMEDVRFTNPNTSNITSECDYSCNGNHGMRAQLTPLDNGLCETQDMHQNLRASTMEPVRNNDSTNDLDRAFLDHQANAPAESSQASGFADMQNTQVPCSTSSSSELRREELHLGTSSTMLPTTIGESLRNQAELTQDNVEMEAFYASLDAGTQVFPHSHVKLVTIAPTEEAKAALKNVQDFISNDASVLLHPEECTVMKTSLDYLSSLGAHDGISGEMRTLIVEASRVFTHWSRDYAEASMKIEYTASELLRTDELEADLEDNKKQFREAVAIEKELLQKLARMQVSKRELDLNQKELDS